MSGNQKILKFISSLYIFITIGLIIASIVAFTPVGKDLLKTVQIPHEELFNNLNMEKNAILGTVFLAMIIPYLIDIILLRRAVKDGRKTTFLLALLVIGIIGNIISIVYSSRNGFSQDLVISVVQLGIDIFLAFNVYKVRIAAE